MTASVEAEIARILVEDPYVGYVIMRERKCAVEYGSSCIYRETQGALLFRKDGVDFPWDIPLSTSGCFRCEIRVKYDLFLPNNPYLVFFKRL